MIFGLMKGHSHRITYALCTCYMRVNPIKPMLCFNVEQGFEDISKKGLASYRMNFTMREVGSQRKVGLHNDFMRWNLQC